MKIIIEKVKNNLFLLKADSLKKNKLLLKELNNIKDYNAEAYSEEFNSLRNMNKNKMNNFDIKLYYSNENENLTKAELNSIIKKILKGSLKKTKMEEYFNDLFYGSNKLGLNNKKEILNRALMVAYDYSLEIREVDSFQRKTLSKDIGTIREFIKNNLFNNSFFVIIKRYKYKNEDTPFGEIGFTNVNSEGNDYYVFVYISEVSLNDLVQEFKLKLI